jgi:hypothetical protein
MSRYRLRFVEIIGSKNTCQKLGHLFYCKCTMKRIKSEPAYLFFRLVSMNFLNPKSIREAERLRMRGRENYAGYTEKRNPAVREFMC